MKTLLAIFIFAVASFRAAAADPVVVIQSASSVTVDGIFAGTVVDVLANSSAKNIRALVLDAWIALEQSMRSAEKKRADDAIADAQAKQAAAEARADAEVANSAAIIASLRGLDPTFLPANVKAALFSSIEKEKAALAAQKAELDAKLSKLP